MPFFTHRHLFFCQKVMPMAKIYFSFFCLTARKMIPAFSFLHFLLFLFWFLCIIFGKLSTFYFPKLLREKQLHLPGK